MYLVFQIPIQYLYTVLIYGSKIIQAQRNLNTFTLAELKKEVIKMKADNFAVTKMKRNHVVNLILTYHYLFPHLMNKTGYKRQIKSVQREIRPLPASIKLPPELLRKLDR